MGFLMDLIQQQEIDAARRRAESVSDRANDLAVRLQTLENRFNELVKILEENWGKDINGDGKVG